MNLITLDNLLPYWSIPHLHANAMILINIVGALLLGMIVGYPLRQNSCRVKFLIH
jgi:putative Mg2+ transporter-C (MgtC) family protein